MDHKWCEVVTARVPGEEIDGAEPGMDQMGE